MSRWSPENLLIALFPARVIAAKIERGWRTRLIDKRVVETADPGPDPPNSNPAGSSPAWRVTVAALEKNLAGFAAPGTPATVIVSSRFVRYTVVPWRDNVVSVPEQAEFARHCFQNIYGEAVADWEIRMSSGGFRRNALACAVDAEMLRAVEKLLVEHSVRIVSIQPNFMAACNRFRRELGGYRSGCIAVLEPGRVALGIFDEAGWRTLSARRIGTLKPDELVPVLAQELKSVDPDGLPEYLFVAAVGPTTSSFFRTRTKAWMSPTRTRIPESVQ
ncbi:MAG: hypothetical protein HY067_02345 [Betaproteobacteria bacterium]|nr:hypothetical protein [Betaproteobacteria bacterium]